MADPQMDQLQQAFMAQLAQLQQLLQMSGGNQLSQLGGMNLPNQQGQTGYRPLPVGEPGQPVGQSGMPQGVMFGGGSPFPVDFGPARLQNALIGIRDLINAASQFKNSPLGKKAFGG